MSESDSKSRSNKPMKYAQLHYELNKLTKNIQELDQHFKQTNEQVPALLKMSTLHAAMLMSAQSVLNKEDNS
ncbi:hypothetical protein G6F70_007898 [Rhizopus microsporus]|uniref:Uncharacterized protein n=1 Tax=Rhizopus azygosporus TaxID=86630 RepID=A0A367JVH9_RHIAZ|nr:hypothetical protein G6F71_007919 [Rhizopus microsporus]RCH93943.1 hypothetical protein CU097_004932 [Rhizopus azygosporus]KAG1195878.1 hypothetical protein G6F70_007898 [Rhizopus microsporus]KAG1207714.1 hypothetical protein G6F69_007819 [Rhizopus microsporus]KAG1228622.1 hypothetical protein G6F67_007705 [Rhizopus microsporus]